MFKYKIIIFLISLFIFNSCSKNENKASTWDFFKNPPKIVFAVESNTDEYRFSFTDRIIDSLGFACSIAYAIVPFEPIIKLETSDFHFSDIIRVDSMLKNQIFPEYDGLQLMANINDTIPTTAPEIPMNSKYPLFIINKTDRIKHIHPNNGALIIFQEAYHRESKTWAPVSYSCITMCLEEEIVYSLKPDYCLIAEVPRFIGNYKTQLRIKFWNGTCIYTSNEFTGSINESQFLMKKFDLKRVKERYQGGIFNYLELQQSYNFYK